MSRTVPRDVVTNEHVSTLPPGYIAYRNDRCRCQDCKDGNADYQAELRAAYRARPDLYPVPAHGKVNAYNNYGCRCPECTAAHNAARRRRREAS